MVSPSLPRPDAVLALFAARGYRAVETAILQPAGLFLDLAGEDIRRRLFLTADAEGQELCLRPEHTIPVCRAHLAAGHATGDYAYCGPVFRHRGSAEPGEFVQAGIESIGAADALAADVAVLGLALDALALWPPRDLVVRTGDLDLLEAVLCALEVPPAMQRRLVRRLSSGVPVADILPAPRPATTDYAGLLAAIEGQDPRAARAFVEDVISIAGISAVGGRSPGEIAERFLSRAANRDGGLGDRARAVLSRFLAIDGPLSGAPALIRTVAVDEGLAIGPALDRFTRRTDFLAARGIALDTLGFSAGLARNFDYYTGFVFDVRDRSAPPGRFLASGGRYDRLLAHLGSPTPLPAVGCSFWIDRLEGAA